MNIRQSLIAITAVASLGGSIASAAAPTCQTYNGLGYCQYTGKVYQAYINSGGAILLYFDTPMAADAPSSVGISGVSVYGAAIFNMSDNPDYGKALYASLLAAQARGSQVSVQLWGTHAGYMKMDRIWVYE